MGNYYFLAASLPALHFDAPPEMTFLEFTTLLNENLSLHDKEMAAVLRRYYDIMNMRSFWKGQAIDQFGNWNEVELEEAIVGRDGIPDYVDEFLSTYRTKEERLAHFGQLINAYFRHEGEMAKGFVKSYVEFERKLRLVLVGLRAKKLGKDVVAELQYEDSFDPIVAGILAQKDAAQYDPPEEFSGVRQIFEEYGDRPLLLHSELCRVRYREAEELMGVHLFSIERILSYMVRLIMVIKLQMLDREGGVKKVDTIIEETA